MNLHNLTLQQLIECLVCNKYKVVFGFNPQTKIINCEIYTLALGTRPQTIISHGESVNAQDALINAIERAIEIKYIDEQIFDIPIEEVTKEYT